jgi:uncharacterized membrane protein
VARAAGSLAGLAYLVYPFVAPTSSVATAGFAWPPILINLALALLFALTLLPGREPLIARFARLERGSLEPDLVAYTRRLTWVWVAFFIAMALVSAALALTGSHRAWTWFTGVGNYLGVGALFLGEHAYRRRRFAHYRHLPPLAYARILRKAMWGER